MRIVVWMRRVLALCKLPLTPDLSCLLPRDIRTRHSYILSLVNFIGMLCRLAGMVSRRLLHLGYRVLHAIRILLRVVVEGAG